MITYDRRGFGNSSQPTLGYDYDTFAADLPKIDVPMLTVQGDADRILPYPNTGKRLPGLIIDMQLVVIEGGPYAITWTHADQVNRALLGFLS